MRTTMQVKVELPDDEQVMPTLDTMAGLRYLAGTPKGREIALALLAADTSACPHDSLSGDEGPVAELGRMPAWWCCDACGVIIHDPTDRGRG